MRRVIPGLVIVVVLLFPLLTSSVFAQCVHGYCPCKGNFDCDDDIDGMDAAIFKSFFGCSPFAPCCRPNCQAPLSKTGQTTSYATGDDGDLEVGIAWEEPRFYDNGDGTVTDGLTGLIWLKNANCFGTRTWNNALSDSNGLEHGECGLTDGSSAGDWRLPNRFELESLLDMENYNPALPSGHPFNNVKSSTYWSSTTYAIAPYYVWSVVMYYGRVDIDDKSYECYVWPVRGGQ